MELRQGTNSVSIVGKLKSKKKDIAVINGVSYYKMTLVVAAMIGNELNEIRAEYFTSQTSKLVKGYETVMNEYKTIVDHGEEAADLVEVIGNLTLNEYIKDGEHIKNNKIKGVFAKRLDDKEAPHRTNVSVEGVILNVTKEIGKDGLLNGDLNLTMGVVGYNGRVEVFENLIVDSSLAAGFNSMFKVGDTGTINMHYLNYCVVTEAPAAPITQGFGETSLAGTDRVAKDYVSKLAVVGGLPTDIVSRYKQEEIAEIQTRREKAIEELKIKAAQKAQAPAVDAGFSTGFDTAKSSSMDNSEIPF